MKKNYLKLVFFALLTIIGIALLPGLLESSSSSYSVKAMEMSKLHIGISSYEQINEDDTGQTEAPNLYARYDYLTGGVSGWSTWNSPAGEYALARINDNASEGYEASILTYYNFYYVGTQDENQTLNKLADPNVMNDLFNDFKLAMQKTNEATAANPNHEVTVHVEPDLWGFIQRDDPNANVAVNSTSLPELSGLSNNVQGLAGAFIELRDEYAPSVKLAYHNSFWASSVVSSGQLHELDTINQATSAATDAAEFYNSLNANFDYIFGEIRDRDADCYTLYPNSLPECYHNLGNVTNFELSLNNYQKYAEYLDELNNQTGENIVLWQVPVGNQSSPNTGNDSLAVHGFQDNVVQTLFKDRFDSFTGDYSLLQDYYDAGVRAILFGAGLRGQTTPLSDNGVLFESVERYYADGPVGNVSDGGDDGDDNNTPSGETPTSHAHEGETYEEKQQRFTNEVIYEINNYRVENNLLPLKYNEDLVRCAQWHAEDMAANDYVGHEDSLQRNPGERCIDLGFPTSGVWENAAGTHSTSPPFNLFSSWRASGPHRENLLKSTHRSIGIGYATQGDRAYGSNPMSNYSVDTFPIIINKESTKTPTRNVTLYIYGNSGGEMRFSNDGSSWSDWEAYNNQKSWDLEGDSGDKTVYYQYRENGQVFESNDDIYFFDHPTNPPQARMSLVEYPQCGNAHTYEDTSTGENLLTFWYGQGLDVRENYTVPSSDNAFHRNSSEREIQLFVIDEYGFKDRASITIPAHDNGYDQSANFTLNGNNPITSPFRLEAESDNCVGRFRWTLEEYNPVAKQFFTIDSGSTNFFEDGDTYTKEIDEPGKYRLELDLIITSISDRKVSQTFKVYEYTGTNPLTDQAYRFFNRTNGTHFYTTSVRERNKVIYQLDDFYTYEGPSFKVFANQEDGASPVYRFFNTNSGSHFFTASARERDKILNRWPDIFKDEGIAYYVYKEPRPGTKPMYRFFNKTNGAHFFTDSKRERDKILDKWVDEDGDGGIFEYENIAYYVAR